MTVTIKTDLRLGGLLPGHVSAEALDEAAQHVLSVAQEKAPVLGPGEHDLTKANDERRAHPGELRESGFVRPVDESTAIVGFSAYWALFQHEDLTYHHDDGEAKFLEIPLTTERDAALEIIAARLREGLTE